MKVKTIGSGVNDRLSSDFETHLNEIVEQKLYKLTKYQTIGTYKCGKELRRERRKQERKNKNK